MKKRVVRVVFSLICLGLFGCSGTIRNLPSQSEQLEITREVQQVFREIVTNSEAANLEGALHYYADSPDFIGVFGDGTVHDYQAFAAGNREFFSQVRAEKFTPLREHTLIIDRDNVLYTWQARATITLNDGTALTMDPFATTFLFRRIGTSWKVIHSQESSLPPPAVPLPGQ